MEHAGIPAGIAALVATVAVGDRYTTEGLVRNVVGGEAAGASAEAYALAQPIAIPMHGQVESLNAAMAGTIILFEAARQRRQLTGRV